MKSYNLEEFKERHIRGIPWLWHSRSVSNTFSTILNFTIDFCFSIENSNLSPEIIKLLQRSFSFIIGRNLEISPIKFIFTEFYI